MHFLQTNPCWITIRITSELTVAWLHIIGLLKLQSTKPSLQGSTPKENLKAREYCQGYDNLTCAIVRGRIVHGRNRKLFQNNLVPLQLILEQWLWRQGQCRANICSSWYKCLQMFFFRFQISYMSCIHKSGKIEIKRNWAWHNCLLLPEGVTIDIPYHTFVST